MTPLLLLQVYGGRYLNDEEITGMLIATLFAGQHTSSITSSWTGLTMIHDKVNPCSIALTSYALYPFLSGSSHICVHHTPEVALKKAGAASQRSQTCLPRAA